MKRFFKVTKKKKNKRRLTILWLFLIVIELFCPVIGEEPIFAAEQDSPVTISQSTPETATA